MLCSNCGKLFDADDLIVIDMVHYHTLVPVCSVRCRDEWVAGYAEEVAEQLKDLEADYG